MTTGATVLIVLGFVLHAIAGWWYVVSGLVVPGPHLFVLWAAWIVLLAVQIVNRRRPIVVLSIPLVAGVFWVSFKGWDRCSTGPGRPQASDRPNHEPLLPTERAVFSCARRSPWR
ncbi:MAG: hypothetical protein M3135_00710, partial [Actinomycetota bacterium]|nr:hypothetical protein [Actinomycetota bacterium]